MLESLRLIDFKSFVDETVPLSPLTFLVGANAAGKSNVLDALRFLQGAAYQLRLSEVLDGEEGREPDAWRGIRGGAREAARYGSTGFAVHSQWRLDLLDALGMPRVAEGRHEIRCEVRPTVRVLEEASVDPEGNDRVRLRRSDRGELVMTPDHLAPGALRDLDDGRSALLRPGPVGDLNVGYYARALERVRFVDIQPDRMRELSRSGPPLRDDGANFSGVLHALSRDPETRKTFIEWVAELCAPELSDLDFIEVEELGDVMAVLIERDGRRISARSMSDGTLKFLGILTAVYTAEEDSIVCFEELGAGLHPARVRLLMELLETVHRERGVQTIATTHSPSLLRWLDDERLGQAVLLARPQGSPGTVVRRLEDLPGFFDAVRSLGLEEMFSTQWLEIAL
ncbi:MAG: AAA family ATPase [Nannocystaceae bacterium]